jgi:hypothetical protein
MSGFVFKFGHYTLFIFRKFDRSESEVFKKNIDIKQNVMFCATHPPSGAKIRFSSQKGHQRESLMSIINTFRLA